MSWLLNLCFVWALQYANGNFRLPGDITPTHYRLKFLYDIDPSTNFSFYGVVDILLTATKPTSKIILHAKNYIIAEEKISLVNVRAQTREARHNEVVPITKVTVDEDYDFLTLDLQRQLLTNEVYSLSIPFNGNLKADLAGAYISSYVDKKSKAREYCVVTVFAPNYARNSFPCFDEPLYKATYKVIIGHHKDYHALSNMPLEKTTNDNKNRADFVWDHFDTSVTMSTYLVAFAVSKFQHVESPRGLSNTKIRVWARPDVIDQTSFAVGMAPKVLSYFETFFNISYVLPKMDHIATHDQMLGGMENWGLIHYNEIFLLYDEKQSTWLGKSAVNLMITHEVSHQWFGNLVTMKWWTELWLKEGFASFMGQLASTAVWPAVSHDNLIAGKIESVLKMDALASSHPVSVSLDDPNRIAELYDSITYSKASILIRMLYLTLGEEVFREAIHNYLLKYSYGNTEQDDLWEQWYEASVKQETLPRNVTVRRVMHAWTTQTGYPLLTVQRDYETNSLTITQKRYLAAERKSMQLMQARSSPSWWIPLSVLSQNDDQRSPPPPQWLADDEGTSAPYQYEHGAGMDEWLLFNANMTALCRVNYDSRNWQLLTDTLKGNNYKSIPTLSRVQLLLDAFELARTGYLDYSVALELASYLHQEEDHLPLSIGLQQLATIDGLLKRTTEYGVFQKYVRKIIQKTYQKVGGLKKQTILRGGDYNSDMMQKYSSQWACQVNVPGCEDDAIELFQQWMNTANPDQYNPIPIELRSTVYCVAVARGNEKHWQFMLARTRSDHAESSQHAVEALGCSREPWLLHRTLELTLSETYDVLFIYHVLRSVVRSAVGFYIGKDFLYKRINEISPSSKTKEVLRSLPITELTMKFTSEEELDEFLAWRDKHAKKLGSITFTVEQSIETARINIAWLAANRQLVVDKLKQFSA